MDFDKLRGDLMDYYGTAMFNGMPMAMMDLSKVEAASDEDLEFLARNAGIDPDDYEDLIP